MQNHASFFKSLTTLTWDSTIIYMKKLLLFVVVLALLVFPVFAEKSINEIISDYDEEMKASLLSGETLQYFSLEDYYWAGNGQDVPALAFDGTMAKEKATEDSAKENAFTMGLSTFVPYPKNWNNLSYEEKKLNVINILLSISSLKGTTYISHSSGYKEKTLFEDAYTLLSSEKRKKASDASFSYAPENYQYDAYGRIKDSVFGSNDYVVHYDINRDEIFMTLTNLDNLKFLMYKCVSKEELDLCIDVTLTKEGVAIFGLATVYDKGPTIKTPVTTVDLPTAFIKRVDSMKNWFIKRISE